MNAPTSAFIAVSPCETPKSPPGDYNLPIARRTNRAIVSGGVKHLNPRQGITTQQRIVPAVPVPTLRSVKHLNPRQGITTSNCDKRCSTARTRCVKHLNPRQGITTQRTKTPRWFARFQYRVKHLNPRQGITTFVFSIVPRRGRCGAAV